MHRGLLAALMLAASVSGHSTALASDARISASLVPETSEPSPGRVTKVVLRMVPQPGWHGYWRNPGDAGGPVSIEWSAPSGVTFGAPTWPAPRLMGVAGLSTYVMEGEYDLVLDMRVAASLKEGVDLPVTAKLSWLACSDSQCVPEHGQVAMSLRTGSGWPDPVSADVVAGAAAAIPARLPGVTARREAGGVEVRLPSVSHLDASAARIYFVGKQVAPSSPQSARDDGGATIVSFPSAEGFGGEPLDAVVSDGRRSWSFAVDVGSMKPAAPSPVRTASVERSAVRKAVPVSGSASGSRPVKVASRIAAVATIRPAERAPFPLAGAMLVAAVFGGAVLVLRRRSGG